ncbi:DUF4974 domain-containing protein [Ravibacter arvi]|uniref:DUF4974 domain-containing protein n=1 Tax=Ravibacter arvi TaxID=2051041 RepID=A0ABP8MBJ5_9BACT
MNKERIRLLLYKYLNNSSSEAENRELAGLLQIKGLETEVKQLLDEAWDDFHDESKPFSTGETERMLAAILGNNEDADPVRAPKRWYYSRSVAAAAAFLLLGAGLVWYTSRDIAGRETISAAPKVIRQDVQPGSDKAFLTLSDGRDIALNNAASGLLATEGNIKIFKAGDDWLSYKTSSHNLPKKEAFHTLRTPRGGQYHLVLPDGTRVWLNAASAITYPIHFSNAQRNVKIEGEVYFEVAKKAAGKRKIPFIVTARDVSVEVLGTQFNINAYQDEKQVSTTLLEGSVKVKTAKFSSMLDPGQEATISNTSNDIRVSSANTDQVIAWKNGFFQFRESSLESIMRQLSKWYDVDVTYEGKPMSKKFTGEIPRSATLLEVLEILELNHIQVELAGNRITIKA